MSKQKFEDPDLKELDISYYYGTLPKEINVNFSELWNIQPEKPLEIVIIGKKIPCPRKTQAYGTNYTYSNQTAKIIPMPEILNPFLNYAKKLTNCDYNGILVNWYENGKSYIGAHGDNETNIIKGSPILSISLGGTRKFRIRKRVGKKKIIVKDFMLKDRDVFTMEGKDFQKKLTHEIVRTAKTNIKPRINMTFRLFKKG